MGAMIVKHDILQSGLLSGSLSHSQFPTQHFISVPAPLAATRRQAATSGVLLSRFHFGPLSKKHVSRDACNPLPYLPLSASSHLPERGRWRGKEGRKKKDHPNWDHSPSIRPFHTLWTWNNQGLIAAVCLRRPQLKVGTGPQSRGRSASASEQRGARMLQGTHQQRHTQTLLLLLYSPPLFSFPHLLFLP